MSEPYTAENIKGIKYIKPLRKPSVRKYRIIMNFRKMIFSSFKISIQSQNLNWIPFLDYIQR